MDNQKDNITPREVDHGYDNNDARKNDPISFFEKDEAFVFVYKKTEKLATAMYMVTNLFGESEPMKWALRRKVGDLLSFTLGYKDIPPSGYADFVHNIRTRVLEIVSLLEVSSRSGLISSMNMSILKEEFYRLLSYLDSASATHSSVQARQTQTLPQGFFDIRRGGVLMSTLHHHGNSSPGTIAVKDNTRSQGGTDVFKRSNRQTLILQLLRKKKEVTIKDVAEVVRNCSEKTIQRELMSLIASGAIKKTGERRWSKYSLV